MFKNLVYSAITKGAVALINFLILIITSRYLGVSSRGEISILLLNIAIVQAINEVYTGYSLVHFIPRFNIRKIVRYGICYTLIACSLSNLILWVLNKQVPGYEWLGSLISLLVILNTFNCVLILGRGDIARYNQLSFVQPFVLCAGVLMAIFFFRVYTLDAYVYPLLFSFVLATGLSSRALVTLLSAPVLQHDFQLRPLLLNGFIFQATFLMQWFLNRYSYYWLPDIAGVGLYASASVLMESVLLFVSAIAPVLLSRVANKGNTGESVAVTLLLSKAGFLFSGLAVLLILVLPESFYTHVLGTGFSGIRQLMIVYAPGIMMLGLSVPVSYYFSAIGKQKWVLACYLPGFVSVLCLTPVWIGRYGLSGAAYSAGLAYGMTALALCVVFLRSNRLGWRRFFSLSMDYRTLRTLLKLKA
jgi:O-antigen/teichoic acid export membrane protein